MKIKLQRYHYFDVPERNLTDQELLEKETRVKETKKKIKSSKLYSIWYSVKTFFVRPDYLTTLEKHRLAEIHKNQNSTNDVISTTNKTDQSIWTMKEDKK